MIEQGDLYWADINPPQKSKPGKRRPVLVLQATDLTAAGKRSVTIVPLTSHLMPENRLRLRLTRDEIPDLPEDSDVLVDQIHTLHISLFSKKIGTVSSEHLRRVMDGIFFIFGLPGDMPNR